MDATETYFDLREAGIALTLSEDRDRLICEPAGALTTPLAEAFAANHDRLLKEQLLKELVRFVTRRISEREDATPGQLSGIPDAQAVFENLANSRERISAALQTEDVPTFKATLRNWGRAALQLHDRLGEADAPPVEVPTAAGASPTDSVGRSAGSKPDPGPVQQSLLG